MVGFFSELMLRLGIWRQTPWEHFVPKQQNHKQLFVLTMLLRMQA